MNFSPIIIGTMRWGIWGAQHSVKEVQKLIETSLNENLSTFDHADIYGDYTTEKLFGDAFSEMSLKREEVQFISKCGIQMPCSNRNYTVKSYNYSQKHIIKSVDQSLENLKTDYLSDVHHLDITCDAPLYQQAFLYLWNKTGRYIIPIPNDDKEWLCMGNKFKTYEEARLECIKKLIEIIKNESK